MRYLINSPKVRLLVAAAFVASVTIPENSNALWLPLLRLILGLAITEFYGLRYSLRCLLIAFVITTSLMIIASLTHSLRPYDLTEGFMVNREAPQGATYSMWLIGMISSAVVFWLSFLGGFWTMSKTRSLSWGRYLWLRIVASISCMETLSMVLSVVALVLTFSVWPISEALQSTMIKDRIAQDLAYGIIYLVVVTPVLAIADVWIKRTETKGVTE